MFVDFKVTVWQRFDVPEELEDEVMEKLRSGVISTGNDLHEFLEEEHKVDSDWHNIIETEEFLTPDENDGQSTIECVGKDTKKTIWTNSQFDSYSISGYVDVLDEDGTCHAEKTEFDNVADYFSLYGHIVGQESVFIGDFKTRAFAENVLARIKQ